MKITKVLLFSALVGVGFSCSKDDDDPKPQKSNLEEVSLSLAKETTVVEAPAAMLNSEDQYAQMASAWIASANAMTTNFALFTPPQGATKTTTPITAANGRTSGIQKEYLVYIWVQQGYGSIAYQISEESDKYVFELFYKTEGSTEWLRSIYAEEKKDRSEGLMKIYYATGETTTASIIYAWKRSGDIVTFTITDNGDSINYILTINEKTKAGSAELRYEGELQYEIEWNGDGSGSWTYYSDGEIYEQGVWTA